MDAAVCVCSSLLECSVRCRIWLGELCVRVFECPARSPVAAVAAVAAIDHDDAAARVVVPIDPANPRGRSAALHLRHTHRPRASFPIAVRCSTSRGSFCARRANRTFAITITMLRPTRPAPVAPRRLLLRLSCALLLLLVCIVLPADAADVNGKTRAAVPSPAAAPAAAPARAHAAGADAAAAALASRLRLLCGFVHPDLRVAPSPREADSDEHAPLDGAMSVGVRIAAELPPRTLLLSVPNSLALTGEAAFESLSSLLTPAQIDAILDVQTDTCEFIDWMMVLYVAVARLNHPAAAAAAATAAAFPQQQDPRLTSAWLQEQQATCPAPFFPVDASQSFSPRLHALWSDTIALYPRACTGAICLPRSVRVSELLNTPLLLRRNHHHIACVERARIQADRVVAALQQCPSRLPPVDSPLLLWAASMLLSRQQSVVASLPPAEDDSTQGAESATAPRVPALLPFFDLFNSHTAAANHSHPLVYRTHDAAVSVAGSRRPVPATQAYTQGTISAGRHTHTRNSRARVRWSRPAPPVDDEGC